MLFFPPLIFLCEYLQKRHLPEPRADPEAKLRGIITCSFLSGCLPNKLPFSWKRITKTLSLTPYRREFFSFKGVIGDLGKIYILSLIGNQCYFPACPTNIQLFYPLCRNMVVSQSIPQCCTRICIPRKILPSIQANTTKWNSRQPTN